LIDTFAAYQKTNHRNFAKHVLYTSREKRPGEKKVTYHFIETGTELRKLGKEKDWHVYPVIKERNEIDLEDTSIQ
jgi:guanylate kinase